MTHIYRLCDERVKDMKVESWTALRMPGISPYTIEKLVGTYRQTENPRTGWNLPHDEWYTVVVTAFEVVHPSGNRDRFRLLKDAKSKVRELKGEG